MNCLLRAGPAQEQRHPARRIVAGHTAQVTSNQAGRAQSLQLAGARVVIAASTHERPDEGRLVGIGLRDHLDAEAVRQALRDSAC